jgi:hypothetical protein
MRRGKAGSCKPAAGCRPRRAADQTATLFNIKRQFVADAKRLRVERPDLFEQVKAGKLKITLALPRIYRRCSDSHAAPKQSTTIDSATAANKAGTLP